MFWCYFGIIKFKNIPIFYTYMT